MYMAEKMNRDKEIGVFEKLWNKSEEKLRAQIRAEAQRLAEIPPADKLKELMNFPRNILNGAWAEFSDIIFCESKELMTSWTISLAEHDRTMQFADGQRNSPWQDRPYDRLLAKKLNDAKLLHNILWPCLKLKHGYRLSDSDIDLLWGAYISLTRQSEIPNIAEIIK